eukprot:COSAG05_NODE_296_length_11959_cov_17.897639_3_plen_107_part_00
MAAHGLSLPSSSQWLCGAIVFRHTYAAGSTTLLVGGRGGLEHLPGCQHLTIGFSEGTYGDDLQPEKDVGSGAPDMIVGFNAGLYLTLTLAAIAPAWRFTLGSLCRA